MGVVVCSLAAQDANHGAEALADAELQRRLSVTSPDLKDIEGALHIYRAENKYFYHINDK